MKAISLKEPWASLVLNGEKTIETRTWKTSYRGELLLCASQKPESSISGMAFAVARLVDIQPMQKCDEAAACIGVYPRAYSWFLGDITPIKQIPVKGKLRLFEVEICI